MKNYYEILEVHKKASQEVIEKAYKVLAKKYHPDLYTGTAKNAAEGKIKDIYEAYKVLSDQFLREQYDRELEKELQAKRKSYINFNSNENSENKRTNSKKLKEDNQFKEDEEEIIEKNYKTGTISGLFDVVKAIFKNKPNVKNIKDLKREDFIAAGLTFVIIVTLGIILWFVPFTHSFVRSLIPF